MAKARDYDKEYREYHGTPEQIKRRAARNKARKKLGLKKGDKRDAAHVNAPRTGSLDNVPTRPQSRKKNRSDQPKRSGKSQRSGTK